MASHERSSDYRRDKRLPRKPRPAAGSPSGRASPAGGAPSRATKLPKVKLRSEEGCGLDEALLKIAEIWKDIQAHRRVPPKS
jgi:hypothetical protein